MIKPLNIPIYVTSPLIASKSDVMEKISEIWDSKRLTNHGPVHNELEEKLTKYLKVANVSVFNNGTIALMVALKALELPFDSEVITTPFTFAATPHSISWNGLRPVFCDIDPETMTIEVLHKNLFCGIITTAFLSSSDST